MLLADVSKSKARGNCSVRLGGTVGSTISVPIVTDNNMKRPGSVLSMFRGASIDTTLTTDVFRFGRCSVIRMGRCLGRGGITIHL